MMSAKINYDYYEGKDVYNDGDIEQVLIDCYKEDIHYEPEEYQDLAYFYLLTPIRKNILNWYPFKKNANILEIGAGAGTITGMLCERAKSVTVVEASKRRAELIYYRHHNRENLNILVGNFNNVPLNQKFDYIVMIGVLEYSQIFSTGKNPYQSFLETIANYLAPGGKLLVAIENKNGLKYWCGASEDHLSKPYIGIQGYEDCQVKTFGRKELENLLIHSGFPYFRFYYPFPDYKLPYSIYTDDYLPTSFSLKKDLIFNHDDYGYYLNPNTVVENIIDNQLLGGFANSFLVEACVDKPIEKEINYAKLNTVRNDKYAIITKINKDNDVIKTSISRFGKEHLNNLYSTHKKLEELGVKCSHIEKEKDDLKIEFLSGITVTQMIENYIKNNEKENIVELINQVFDYLEKNLVVSVSKSELKNKLFDFKEFYKDKIKVLKIGLIDLNFSNIMIHNEDYIIFDQEWTTNEPLVFDYVKYFSIKLLYEQLPQLEKMIPVNIWYEKYQLSSSMQKQFNQASEKYFFEENDVFDYKIYKIVDDRRFIKIRDEITGKNWETKIEEKEKQIQELSNQLSVTNKKLTDIENRKSWKMITKLTKVADKFKKTGE